MYAHIVYYILNVTIFFPLIEHLDNSTVFDSEDTHASSTIHIQKYADHLRKCYKRWCAESSTKPALYVDLAVVEKDENYSSEVFLLFVALLMMLLKCRGQYL